MFVGFNQEYVEKMGGINKDLIDPSMYSLDKLDPEALSSMQNPSNLKVCTRPYFLTFSAWVCPFLVDVQKVCMLFLLSFFLHLK